MTINFDKTARPATSPYRNESNTLLKHKRMSRPNDILLLLEQISFTLRLSYSFPPTDELQRKDRPLFPPSSTANATGLNKTIARHVADQTQAANRCCDRSEGSNLTPVSPLDWTKVEMPRAA
jgi:hypothetical protein